MALAPVRAAVPRWVFPPLLLLLLGRRAIRAAGRGALCRPRRLARRSRRHLVRDRPLPRAPRPGPRQRAPPVCWGEYRPHVDRCAVGYTLGQLDRVRRVAAPPFPPVGLVVDAYPVAARRSRLQTKKDRLLWYLALRHHHQITYFWPGCGDFGGFVVRFVGMRAVMRATSIAMASTLSSIRLTCSRMSRISSVCVGRNNSASFDSAVICARWRYTTAPTIDVAIVTTWASSLVAGSTSPTARTGPADAPRLGTAADTRLWCRPVRRPSPRCLPPFPRLLAARLVCNTLPPAPAAPPARPPSQQPPRQHQHRRPRGR